MVFGQTKRPLPSRFIEEIDKSVCDIIDKNIKRYNLENSFGAQNSSLMGQARRPVQKATGFANQTSSLINTQKTKTSFGAAAGAAKKSAASYNVGDRVLHKVFGEGIVAKITPLANDAMLEINFDSVGTKKIMANYTPITKLN